MMLGFICIRGFRTGGDAKLRWADWRVQHPPSNGDLEQVVRLCRLSAKGSKHTVRTAHRRPDAETC